MKKNQFKPQDFKYEPRRQQKQPLWMHSVQTYRTGRTTIGELLIIVAIMLAIALVWAVLGGVR